MITGQIDTCINRDIFKLMQVFKSVSKVLLPIFQNFITARVSEAEAYSNCSGTFIRRTTSICTESLKLLEIPVAPRDLKKKRNFLPKDLAFFKFQI